jgi:hypothetical protein
LDRNNKTLAQGYEKIASFQYGQDRFGVAPSVAKSEIPVGQTKDRMPVFFLGPVLFASPETDSGEEPFSGLSTLTFPWDGQNDGGIPFAFSHGVSCGHIFSLSLDELKALNQVKIEIVPSAKSELDGTVSPDEGRKQPRPAPDAKAATPKPDSSLESQTREKFGPKLAEAKKLIEAKDFDAARRILREINDTAPLTNFSLEARQLLKSVQDQK